MFECFIITIIQGLISKLHDKKQHTKLWNLRKESGSISALKSKSTRQKSLASFSYCI